MRGKIADPNYKPQFAGHETFPLRQLWLRKAYDAVDRYGAIAPRSVFSEPDAIVTFGVGKNMVAAIRHWGLACNVIIEVKSGYSLGPVGVALFGSKQLDPYFESPATAWLVHWLLAGEGFRSTTWYYMFNYVSLQGVEKAILVSGLRKALDNRDDVRVSDSTLSRDVDVCLRSYIPKDSTDMAEELAEPVLAQLGLITATRGSYDFRVGPKPSLPDGVFLYALTSFWLRHAENANTLSFDQIALERGGPGMTFKLDIDSTAERLVDIEQISSGVYAWSDTAGMKQVVRRKEVKPEDFLACAYGRAN
jgi:hypothetical protein